MMYFKQFNDDSHCRYKTIYTHFIESLINIKIQLKLPTVKHHNSIKNCNKL